LKVEGLINRWVHATLNGGMSPNGNRIFNGTLGQALNLLNISRHLNYPHLYDLALKLIVHIENPK